MLHQLIIGAGVIAATSIIHAIFVAGALAAQRVRRPGGAPGAVKLLRSIAALAFAMLWLITAHGLSIAIWAGMLTVNGVFEQIETATYFAMVTYTTLGLGGLDVAPEWRLLPGIIAANGFLLFGFSAAFAVEFSSRLTALKLRG
ncbi:MAG: hypothetical protein Tsb0010_11220 [Parvularculaceae bacterium]